MISSLWIDLRKHNWNRLDALATQAERNGIRSLDRADLRDLGLLYRQAAADLSAVRADAGSRTLEIYLNRLVGRAHNLVYTGHRLSAGGVMRFVASGYPRLLRKLMPYIVLSSLLLVVTAVLGALITTVRPAFAYLLISPEVMARVDQHQMWTDSILSAKPEASAGIMTNNIMVCFITFAAGITAGLGTLWYIGFNGFNLGVVAATCAQHGLALSLWSFVVSHGALEIPSIVFSGAAGLRLGAAMLFPGMLRRRDALVEGASEAVQLLSITVPLLIVAGTLEAFLSPTHAPIALKFGVGAFLFTMLCVWLGEGGRGLVNKGPASGAQGPAGLVDAGL